MAALDEQQESEQTNVLAGEQSVMMEILQDIQQRMQGVEARLDSIETTNDAESSDTANSSPQVTPQASAMAQATPATVRADANTMAEVAARLAEWGLQDDEDTGRGKTPPVWGSRTRKSGTVTTGTDSIKYVIDWPHFHVRKGPKRVTPEFEQLTSEEFVLGYLRMLDDPNSKFDTSRMLQILQDVMEDAVDFGWDRARSFYGMVGLDVEHKRLDWHNTQELLKMRLTHARAGFPQGQIKAQKNNSPAKVKTCAPFQTGECEHSSDHGAFKHICDYCLRVRSLSFPHAEGECKTKKHNQSKNA